MDVPSPLLEKFLPVEVSRRISDSDVQRENACLDCLCFHYAMCFYFRTGRVIERFSGSSNMGQLMLSMLDFRRLVNGELSKMDVIQSDTQIVVVPIPVSLRIKMARIGRQCCNKLIFPFSTQRSRDPGFVVSVASSFEHVFQRLRILWSLEADLSSDLLTSGIILDQIISSWSTNWELCGRLSALVLETFCLELYQAAYSLLTPAEKADANNLTTRKMFWGASFFYNMIKPKWDREREFSEWIDEAIDAYLSELQGNHRMDFFNTVAATLCRVQTKYDTLERLKNRLELIDTGDADTRASLTRQATQLSNLPVEIFEFSSLERRLFGDCVHDINLTLFILEDGEFEVQMEQVDVNPASNASRGASRSLESIIAEVDNAAEDGSMQEVMDGLVGDAMHWVEEEETNRPKKKTKNQRRRQAKEKQTAELASILGELCAKVARETVVENERRAMEAAEEERRRAIAAEEEKKRLEMIAAEEREMICAGLMDSVVGEIAKELAKELKAEMSLRSQKDVLEQAKMGVLPPGFVQELLVSEFPAVDNMLQPVVECFICMQPIDFRDPRVRFLVCCSGGSFSCPDCIAIHSPPDRHAVQAERQIVVLAASLRRRLKLGEFA
jgi:hypothetical protein